MNIEYQVLDKSWLPKVYRLAHDSNVEAGHINPKPDLFYIQNRDLDESGNTVIIGALNDNNLTGTCSVTANGRHGLLADQYFPEEYGQLVFSHARLGAFWRMATSNSSPRLILGLIESALTAAAGMGIEKLVFMCTDDHAETYQKLVGAETVANKTIQFEAQAVEASLMLLDVEAGLNKIKGVKNDNFRKKSGGSSRD